MNALKTSPEQIQRFDEECATVAAEAGFELAGEAVVTDAVEVVVISGRGGGTAIRNFKSQLQDRELFVSAPLRTRRALSGLKAFV